MKRFKITLRMRIFFSMILLILVSFFLTGAISFYHFKNANEKYHQERLRRKESAIIESIDYFLRNQNLNQRPDSIVKVFGDKICELADINDMDINIYTMSGNLIISSDPRLHEENIISERLPLSLKRQLAKSPEAILMKTKVADTLTYLSTYEYLHNQDQEPVAIINLPYFDNEDVHRQDIRNFLMRLGEIYLFLFLVSILIAYFLSNYITGSLEAIGQKLKNIRINEPNPPLKWRFDDEIGTLVDEYNRMLSELEKSATKLAKTERESAWREMAKQVAHEIKNPLTPMRLNVQHLQKTLVCEDPERLKAFSESMISQIDTLSNIATAFSQFANMPDMRTEKFPAREIIQRVTVLYPEYNIRFVCENPEVLIQGDRDQLVRVMNNLINNAIQAIPEDREPCISVELEQQNGEVLIAVKDNGVGITKEQEEKIFEPRFTTKTKGMGLGLAMVKNIIDAFKGKVWFRSQPGEGTTFYISLPLA